MNAGGDRGSVRLALVYVDVDLEPNLAITSEWVSVEHDLTGQVTVKEFK
jgi:hypothetical protein